MAKVNVNDWLLKLPVLERDPFKGNSNDPVYAVQSAMVWLNYKTYLRRDVQQGFVFGVDPERRTIYFSRYALEETEGIRACNSHDHRLDSNFVDEVDVLRDLE